VFPDKPRVITNYEDDNSPYSVLNNDTTAETQVQTGTFSQFLKN